MKQIVFFILVCIFSVSVNAGSRAIDHAPLGIMGDHLHKKGEWMLSFRYIEMRMKDNFINGRNASNEEILSQPNPFSSMAGMPSNLSVVPRIMLMRMVMPGLMYAPNDQVTLMAMAMFTEKEMELSVYQPMMTRNYIGSFQSSTNGLSTVSLSALIKGQDQLKSRGHFHLGLEKSVGDATKTGKVLTPMNMQTTMILPYGMQMSDNSTRALLGYTHVFDLEGFLWGNQILTQKILEKDVWAFSEKTIFNTWIQQSFSDHVSISGRLHYEHQEDIQGRNASIMAPVQTANPSNYGGEVFSLAIGFNFLGSIFDNAAKDRVAVELVMPVNQEKNGVQMKNQYTVSLGYQRSF